MVKTTKMKMCKLAIVLCFITFPVLAQTPQATPDDYQAAIQMLMQQRESNANQLVEAAVKLAAANREIERLKAEQKKDKE